jgi:hypothetical protein
MGYLANAGNADFNTLKTALGYGTVAASFAIENFSLLGISSATRADIDKRFETLKKLTQF